MSSAERAPTALLPAPALERGPGSGRRALQNSLTALLAWGITVAPVIAAGGSALAWATAGLALAAGLAGPWLVERRPLVGRHLGLSAFLGLTTGTWLLAPLAIQPSRLDPTRALLGSLAWGLFALSWRAPRPPLAAAPPPSTPLEPRRELPAGAMAIMAVGCVAALGCVGLAFYAREPERALFAQVASLGAASALVTVAALVATRRGTSPARRAWSPLLSTLALLVIVGALGAFVLLR